MSDTYLKVISDAEKTISDVCAGRKCLPGCLERLRRTGSPGPCGCGGPGRRVLFWLWALAVVGFMVAVFKCYGAGLCVWNGDGYVCNGSGSYVYVTGGGDGSGDVVITNIVGTCTNCVAMSPGYVREFKQQAYDIWLDLDIDANLIAQEYAPSAIAILAPYAGKCDRGGLDLVDETRSIYSNFFVRVGLKFPNGSGGPGRNKAAELVNDLGYSNITGSSLEKYAAKYAQYDGAAAAFNDAADAVIDATNTIQYIQQSAQLVSQRGYQLHTMIESLSEEACTAQYDGPSTSGPGSGVVTNQVTGDWCTFEQGRMIISTLQSIDDWFKEQEKYLQSLTNWVSVVNHTIIANLNTTYNAIPDVNGLSDTWQNIYLDGQPQPWGYQPTNILARIELLLYGLTGVGTNHTSVVDTEEAQEDGTESLSDAVSDAVSEADFSRQTEQLTSIKDALLRFCDAFYVENPNLQNARFTPEIRFRLDTTSGEQFETTFDSVTIPRSQVGTVEAIIETIRVACIVFYYVLMAYCVFSFWRTIAKYVIFAIKWAQELLTSIFAD